MKSFKTTISYPATKKDWHEDYPDFKEEEKIINGQIVWIDSGSWGNKIGYRIYYLNEDKVLNWVFTTERTIINY